MTFFKPLSFSNIGEFPILTALKTELLQPEEAAHFVNTLDPSKSVLLALEPIPGNLIAVTTLPRPVFRRIYDSINAQKTAQQKQTSEASELASAMSSSLKSLREMQSIIPAFARKDNPTETPAEDKSQEPSPSAQA